MANHQQVNRNRHRNEPVRTSGKDEAHSSSAPPAAEGRFADSVFKIMEEHPIPVALVAIGLGAGAAWLVMGNTRRPTMSSRLLRVLEEVAGPTRELERAVAQVIPKGPVAIGAAVLTVAAGVTLAVLSTRREQSWLSKSRGHLMDLAHEVVHDAIGRVEAIAAQLNDDAMKAVGAAR